jgi:hypothetical protein
MNHVLQNSKVKSVHLERQKGFKICCLKIKYKFANNKKEN